MRTSLLYTEIAVMGDLWLSNSCLVGLNLFRVAVGWAEVHSKGSPPSQPLEKCLKTGITLLSVKFVHEVVALRKGIVNKWYMPAMFSSEH